MSAAPAGSYQLWRCGWCGKERIVSPPRPPGTFQMCGCRPLVAVVMTMCAEYIPPDPYKLEIELLPAAEWAAL